MYSAVYLHRLRNCPETVSLRPDGPDSGYLVIDDDEEPVSCFGCCSSTIRTLRDLPLPQNKQLFLMPFEDMLPIFFIPVLNQPLSSNQYYVIEAIGECIGEAYTCSEAKYNFRTTANRLDVERGPWDPKNIYQQFMIGSRAKPGLFVRPVAPESSPPVGLRGNRFKIYSVRNRNFRLKEASGLDPKLRSQLPSFDFPLSREASEPVVVGKWYTPFLFVSEGSARRQVRRSPYYLITLEQRWEKIFSRRRDGCCRGDCVVTVEKEEAFVRGVKATWDENSIVQGCVWFMGVVGLMRELVERMKLEQERGGFIRGNDSDKIDCRAVDEEEQVVEEWKEFGCYVLVERFNFRRMDGTLVLSCDFKHSHHIKYKWE